VFCLPILNFSSIDAITAEMFDSGMSAYLVSREESEGSDMRLVSALFDRLMSIGSIACQNIVFGFGGYDDDPREIYVIPKAREFIAKLIETYPCFGYFVTPADNALLACMLPLDDIRSNSISLDVVTQTLRRITDGIRDYGKQIGDQDGARRAVKEWQRTCLHNQ
jgi:hypothetical protein